MKGRTHPTRRLGFIDFLRPFQMIQYPSVVIPMMYYAVYFAYGTILYIVTSANLFKRTYHFDSRQTGMLLGLPLTIGGILGKLIAGGFSDWIAARRAVAKGVRSREDRLVALLPGAFLLPAGAIIEGVCLTRKTHYMGAGMGITISTFGLQVITTVVFTCCTEVSYSLESVDLSLLPPDFPQYLSSTTSIRPFPIHLAPAQPPSSPSVLDT
jgi:hypothetical protein